MRVNRGISVAALLLVMVLAGGCVKRPKGVMSDSEMVPIIADMELAEGYLQTQPMKGDSRDVRQQLVASVLEKHGVSQEEFDATMDWYGHNIDAYYKLNEKVSRELVKRRGELAKAGAKGSKDEGKPSADLWPYSRTAVLTEQSGSMSMPFSVPAEFAKGSSVTWSMRVRRGADAVQLLGVEYDNGEITYLSRPTSEQKIAEMTLQTDSARRVKRVFGNLSVRRMNGLPLWLDSITLEAQPIDTLQYYRINTQRNLPKMGRKQKRRP